MLALAFLLVACSKEQPIAEDLSPIPSNTIDYHVARVLAAMELGMDVKDLAEVPHILYDVNDVPNYYEFTSQNPVGTIVTYATKVDEGVVAYILNEIRPATKSQLMEYCVGYPYGITTCKEEAISLQAAAEVYVAELEDIRAEREAQSAAVEPQVQSFWQQIDALTPELLALNTQGYPQTKAQTTQQEWVIPAYDTEAMQKTFWKGGCGPAAIAMWYRGVYTHYKGVYLPIHGDPEFNNVEGRVTENGVSYYFYKDEGDHDGDGEKNMLDREWVSAQSQALDNGLYADIANFSWFYFFGNAFPCIGWGAALPTDLPGCVERVTDEYTCSMFPLLGNARQKQIIDKQLSMIALTGIFEHYIHVYGYREYKTQYNILGLKLNVVSSRFWKANDNGTKNAEHASQAYWVKDNILNITALFPIKRK